MTDPFEPMPEEKPATPPVPDAFRDAMQEASALLKADDYRQDVRDSSEVAVLAALAARQALHTLYIPMADGTPAVPQPYHAMLMQQAFAFAWQTAMRRRHPQEHPET